MSTNRAETPSKMSFSGWKTVLLGVKMKLEKTMFPSFLQESLSMLFSPSFPRLPPLYPSMA